MHLVWASSASVARDPESNVGQRGGRNSAIPVHHAESDYPAIAAAAGHLEKVVAHGLDLGGQGKGSVVRWLAHLQNESRTYA
jgi:hypothetical protein